MTKQPLRVGPEAKLTLSCFGCEHCKTSGYTCQGDSGTDVFCGAMDNRTVGDTRWDTPDWCPYREAAIQEIVQKHSAKA
jgi:hypothetical protein